MKTTRDVIRQNYLAEVKKYFTDKGDEVIVTGSNEFATPVVDSEGNEFFVKFVVSVPKGARDEAEYDAYGLAQEYEMKCRAMAEKKIKQAEDKRKKIARDVALRKAKADSKGD